MHPDSIIAGLRKELEELRPDDTERREAIEAEIEYADSLPRPVVKEGNQATVADKTRVYYDALTQELASVPDDRKDEILAEMTRVEDELAATPDDGVEPDTDDDGEPDADADGEPGDGDGQEDAEEPADTKPAARRRATRKR